MGICVKTKSRVCFADFCHIALKEKGQRVRRAAQIVSYPLFEREQGCMLTAVVEDDCKLVAALKRLRRLPSKDKLLRRQVVP